jgi:hypothetical protein
MTSVNKDSCSISTMTLFIKVALVTSSLHPWKLFIATDIFQTGWVIMSVIISLHRRSNMHVINYSTRNPLNDCLPSDLAFLVIERPLGINILLYNCKRDRMIEAVFALKVNLVFLLSYSKVLQNLQDLARLCSKFCPCSQSRWR